MTVGHIRAYGSGEAYSPNPPRPPLPSRAVVRLGRCGEERVWRGEQAAAVGVASSRQGRQQAGLAGKQGRQPGQVEIDDVDFAAALDGADLAGLGSPAATRRPSELVLFVPRAVRKAAVTVVLAVHGIATR